MGRLVLQFRPCSLSLKSHLRTEWVKRLFSDSETVKVNLFIDKNKTIIINDAYNVIDRSLFEQVFKDRIRGLWL